MKVKGISKRAMNLLTEYEWNGNVRELENTIESIMVINSPEVIDISHLPQEIRDFEGGPEVIPIKIGTPLEEVEREILIQTLKATRGNKRKAAQLLGINVRTIHRKMEGLRERIPPDLTLKRSPEKNEHGGVSCDRWIGIIGCEAD